MVLAVRPSKEDPLAHITAPPPNESEAARQARLAAEAEAKRISDAIDSDIQQEKASNNDRNVIKVLLLGQSESGKSTVLKNFQLMHSSKAFKAERASWRAVVLLNVVRSIRIILEVMSEFHDAQNSASRAYTSARPMSSQSARPSSSSGSLLRLTPEHLKLKLRLLPLLQVEEVLIKKLTPPGSPEFEATHLAPLTNLPGPWVKTKNKEVAVNSQFAWKVMFSKVLPTSRDSFDSADLVNWDDPDDPGRVIFACSEDMIKLWKDPTIQLLLRQQKVRLEDQPGFFLNDLERVTSPRYIPSDDDILRARLKTIGCSEHRFKFKEDNPLGFAGTITREWRVYDVGGARSLRAAWAPYFDDVNVILFLAPISAFDQMLAEDPQVNRLEDSVLLWKSVVSNKLLTKTNIVLFLNKRDILDAKLKSGIRFADHLISYGDRPNDAENTAKYLQRKFAQIHKEHSPPTRGFFCHITCCTVSIDAISPGPELFRLRPLLFVQDPKDTQYVLTDGDPFLRFLF
ncbi:G-alpha-domain-containing protein [Panus rudis PR-1116 ss-1]|nr:G-alpha-domain-containing protein [Panus rudis PR-1116 ss-1]